MKKSLFVCTFLAVASFFPAYASDYIGWWNFNDGTGATLSDKSGNGYDGSIVGPTWASGIDGYSLSFANSSDCVIIPDRPALNFNAGSSFSISLWVKGPRTQLDGAGIVNKGIATLEQYCVDMSQGGYRFYARDQYATVTMVISQVFPNNTWDHVVAVMDRSLAIMKIYVNGALKASAAPPSSLYQTTEPLVFGNRKNIGSSLYNLPLNGCIDDVRLFNRALSDSEVKSLYYYPFGPVVFPVLIPVSSPTNNRRPTMAWHSFAKATSYSLQIDTTKSFVSPLIKTILLDTVFKPLADLPVDTLYWQVIAAINDSVRSFSEIGSFIIQDPRVPILIPYVPKATIEKRPVFAWHTVSGATVYTLTVSSNNSFASPIMTLPLSDTLYKTITDMPVGHMYWKVKSDLVATWSSIDSFQIQSDSVPLLIRFNGATVKNVRPKFLWKKVANATTYRIEWDDNSGFVNTFATLVQDTSYTPTADLKPGIWYWRASCDRDYSLFPYPDSLVVDSPSSIRNGYALVQNKLGLSGKICEMSVYTLAGSRIAAVPMTGASNSIYELLAKSQMKLSKGVYVFEVKTRGRVQMHGTFLQH